MLQLPVPASGGSGRIKGGADSAAGGRSRLTATAGRAGRHAEQSEAGHPLTKALAGGGLYSPLPRRQPNGPGRRKNGKIREARKPVGGRRLRKGIVRSLPDGDKIPRLNDRLNFTGLERGRRSRPSGAARATRRPPPASHGRESEAATASLPAGRQAAKRSPGLPGRAAPKTTQPSPPQRAGAFHLDIRKSGIFRILYRRNQGSAVCLNIDFRSAVGGFNGFFLHFSLLSCSKNI